MAGFDAVAGVGQSLERFLTSSFAETPPVDNRQTRAVLVRTDDLRANQGVIVAPALSLLLYRIEVNKTLRAAWSAVGSLDGLAHLPLDLHFLCTAWAENALQEYRILGRTMQCLETVPILSGPLLVPDVAWAPTEAVQVVLDDVGADAVMRAFDVLPVDYRLSVPYVARVVRIDGRQAAASPPVTTAAIGVQA